MCYSKHDLKSFSKLGGKNGLKMWLYDKGMLDQEHAACKIEGVCAFRGSSTGNIE